MVFPVGFAKICNETCDQTRNGEMLGELLGKLHLLHGDWNWVVNITSPY